MHPRLAGPWQRLTAGRDRILEELGSLSPEQLRRRPNEATWSLIEVVEHLMLTEKGIFAVVRKNRGAGKPITLRGRLRSAMVLTAMALPVRVRVPEQVKALHPTRSHLELGTFAAEWEADRRQMAEYLAGLSVRELREGVFKHPVGGWTTPRGALIFLESHLWHHGYQMKRIRKAI